MSCLKSAKIVTCQKKNPIFKFPKPCSSHNIDYAKALMQYYIEIIVAHNIYNEKSYSK